MRLDIFAGFVIGSIATGILGEWHLGLVLFGVFSALTPDIDFIVYMIKNKWHVDQYAHEHRDLLHKPLLFSLIIGLVVFAFGNAAYAWVWIAGTLWHCAHDTFEGGWGIQWLYPFYKGYFTLVSYSPKKYIRTKEEQRALAAQYGNPQWLKNALVDALEKRSIRKGIRTLFP